jgi:hypothetical protein
VQAYSESAVCCHPEHVEGFVCWPINGQLQLFFNRMKLLMKAVSLKQAGAATLRQAQGDSNRTAVSDEE